MTTLSTKKVDWIEVYIFCIMIFMIFVHPILACNQNYECPSGQYCHKEACAVNGTCMDIPQNCTMQYDPVCGCDGKTYSNECVAHSNGINVAYKGDCRDKYDITLQLEVEGDTVKAWWDSDFSPEYYVLLYAPFPSCDRIGMIGLDGTNIETRVPKGSDYYVAISGIAPDGSHVLSNVEYFRMRDIWKPVPGTTWQWQLSGTVDLSVDAEMFDIDLFDVPVETIDAIHQKGAKVICYFSAGSYETWRPDSYMFPEEVIGNPLEGWEDERWLDISALDKIAPVMKARLDLAVNKGCDGVEPDNVDGYANDTGFDLTSEDQLTYNKWLSREAHKRGLSIGLKNDIDQIEELEPYFDWALNEECFYYDECDRLLPFIKAGKAVFGVEYELDREDFCAVANAMGFSFLKKDWDLDAWREPCN